MLKALEEVTVTFTGKNCEDVRWPVLHPGERPVVWVSQDESAYHSNDDVAPTLSVSLDSEFVSVSTLPTSLPSVL